VANFWCCKKTTTLKIVVDFVLQCDILEFVQLIKRSKMRGSVIMLVSFLIVFGAVGGIEVNPDADLLTLMMVAIGGLIGMLIGVSVMREDA
jgi:hypothetical protein